MMRPLRRAVRLENIDEHTVLMRWGHVEVHPTDWELTHDSVDSHVLISGSFRNARNAKSGRRESLMNSAAHRAPLFAYCRVMRFEFRLHPRQAGHLLSVAH